MRLSSSFSGTSNGESIPLPLGLEYLELAGGVRNAGGGVRNAGEFREGFVVGRMVDFVDFGVRV